MAQNQRIAQSSMIEPSAVLQRAIARRVSTQVNKARELKETTYGEVVGPVTQGRQQVKMSNGDVTYVPLPNVITTGAIQRGQIVSVTRPIGGQPFLDAMARG